MCLWIYHVIKLSRDKAIWRLFYNFIGFCDRTFHTFRTIRKHQFCPIGFHQFSSFNTHGLRHRDDQLHAQCSRYRCKTDSGISACWFYKSSILVDFTFFQSIQNDRFSHTVFYTSGRIKIFKLCDQICIYIFFLLDTT